MGKSKGIKMDKNFLEECLNKGMSTRDIEKICDKKRSTISYWINKYHLKEKSKYNKTENYRFEKIDTPEKAYCLGFILADSYINKTNIEISVEISDKYVLDFISSVIGGNVQCDYTYDKKSRRFPRARLIKKIVDITKFTGGYLKKDRHYPRIRDDLERYLILGLFDSDGCITWGRRKDKNRISEQRQGVYEGRNPSRHKSGNEKSAPHADSHRRERGEENGAESRRVYL